MEEGSTKQNMSYVTRASRTFQGCSSAERMFRRFLLFAASVSHGFCHLIHSPHFFVLQEMFGKIFTNNDTTNIPDVFLQIGQANALKIVLLFSHFTVRFQSPIVVWVVTAHSLFLAELHKSIAAGSHLNCLLTMNYYLRKMYLKQMRRKYY